jgi:hypothetical protein
MAVQFMPMIAYINSLQQKILDGAQIHLLFYVIQKDCKQAIV